MDDGPDASVLEGLDGLGGAAVGGPGRAEAAPDWIPDVVPDGASGGGAAAVTAGPGPDDGGGAVPDGDKGAPAEPDYGPGRDTVFRRETWPPYAYPPFRFPRISMAFMWALAGLACGVALASGTWMAIRAIQERVMYQNVEQVIRAQWPGMPVTLRAGYHDDLTGAPYYGHRAWNEMHPVENEDGSFTLDTATSKEFCALVLAIREYMDDLMREFAEDESFQGFTSAEPSLDYDVVTVQTPMHRASLIDQERAKILLRQMKIHNLLYRAVSGEEPVVRLVFVNNGETVLTMQM